MKFHYHDVIYLSPTQQHHVCEVKNFSFRNFRRSCRVRGKSEFRQTYRWCLWTTSTFRKKNIQFRSTWLLRKRLMSRGEEMFVERSWKFELFLSPSSGDCMTRIHKLRRDKDFERAMLLMRAGRACWTETKCFGAQNTQPEDGLMLMKEIYLAGERVSLHPFFAKEFLINFPFGWRSKWIESSFRVRPDEEAGLAKLELRNSGNQASPPAKRRSFN